ncbi:MAG: (d)CMP kinase [Ruminococcaceae bacterium]|nr:(d)CMP kinase [Oscillospiraceae bacterium]
MISVAIDGPAGAGKSSLARAAAKELGFIYVDTGALYRTLGLKLIRTNTSVEDILLVEQLLKTTKVEIRFVQDEQHVFLDGEDVTSLIRTPEVSMTASKVSAIPAVRAYLLEMQRSLAKSNNVLMDGRDIGTVVLPNATVKIFLTASVEERAKRRYKELVEKGSNVTFDEVYADIEKRDYADSHREIAPLKPADDSKIVDTTGLSIEESLNLLLKTVNEGIEEK